MKKLLGLLMMAVVFTAVQVVQADPATPVASPAAATQQAVKAATSSAARHKKSKKAKKTAQKKESKAVWVCPMGDYSGPKTADGKCPNCHMDLVEQK